MLPGNTIFLRAIIYEVNKSLLSHFSTARARAKRQQVIALCNLASVTVPLLANFSANKISHLPPSCGGAGKAAASAIFRNK